MSIYGPVETFFSYLNGKGLYPSRYHGKNLENINNSNNINTPWYRIEGPFLIANLDFIEPHENKLNEIFAVSLTGNDERTFHRFFVHSRLDGFVRFEIDKFKDPQGTDHMNNQYAVYPLTDRIRNRIKVPKKALIELLSMDLSLIKHHPGLGELWVNDGPAYRIDTIPPKRTGLY
jgi:hypothetical protein